MFTHVFSLCCRDLKSGNLLVDAADCVKVADFGLSRLQPGANTLTGETRGSGKLSGRLGADNQQGSM